MPADMKTFKISKAGNMENTMTKRAEGSARISKAGRYARTHKGFVYEVTDPELRSQLSFYRKQMAL